MCVLVDVRKTAVSSGHIPVGIAEVIIYATA